MVQNNNKGGTMKRFLILFVLLAGMTLTASSYIITFNGQIAKDAQGNILTTMTAQELTWDIRSKVIAQYKMNDNAANTVITESISGSNGVLSKGFLPSITTADVSEIGKIDRCIGTYDRVATNFITVQDSILQASTAKEYNFWFCLDALYAPSYLLSDASTTANKNYFYISLSQVSSTYYLRVALMHDTSVAWLMNHTLGTATDVANNWTGQWKNIRITHNGTEPSLYINNSLVSVSFATDVDRTVWIDDLYDGTYPPVYFRIAGFWNSSYQSFPNGKWDNVLILNTPLTDDEATYIYNNGNGTEELYG
jgi:hypothetical protein